MKKVYLLASSVVLTGLVSAQHYKTAPTQDLLHQQGTSENTKDLSNFYSFEKAAGDSKFQSDFSTGISQWTTAGAQGGIWMADTDGPNGAFSAADNSDILGSTTAAN